MEPFPTHLPILQVQNRVILPHTFARVELSGAGGGNNAFLEQCLSASNTKPQLVALIPVVSPTEAKGQPEETFLPLDKQGRAIGSVSRIMQVSRLIQGGSFVLVLEGLGRVAVDNAASLHLETLEPFDRIKVVQLEEVAGYLSSGVAAQEGRAAAGGDEELEEMSALAAKMKKTMAAFVKIVARRTGAAVSPAKRLLDTLEKLPPWQAADVVGAALSSTVEDRLQVLHTLHRMERLQLALARAKRALELARNGAGNSSAASTTPTTPTPRAGPDAITPRLSAKPAGEKQANADAADDDDVEDDNDDDDDLNTLAKRLREAGPPPDMLKAAMKEVKRMRRAGENQPSYLASRAYLEVVAELPWRKTSVSGDVTSTTATTTSQPATASTPLPQPPRGPLPLSEARKLLDKQHFGLSKIKDRVVEYLAVLRLRGTSAKAPILCFIGPPGVGKTSLARSVAQVLGRPFVRIALGGVRDEAEVRGHRRTYIGAMPGRVIQGLRKAGVSDPVMLLDEVDKLGKDALRGDPASALLEVLDPEQNQHFTDTYLGHPFDLSQVTFVATANRASDIPAPLLDRLEVIELDGYTLEEKVHIARVHLLPRLLVEHGIAALNFSVKFPDAVLAHIAEGYTREAGVRSLSRSIAAICRHLAVTVVEESDLRGGRGSAGGGGGAGTARAATSGVPLSLRHEEDEVHGMQVPAGFEGLGGDIEATTELVEKVLGPPRFELGGAKAKRERVAAPGAATGLVWTAVGGGVQYIECVRVNSGVSDRPGNLTLTGQVGEVLQESCQLALSWIRAHAQELGLVATASSRKGGSVADLNIASTHADLDFGRRASGKAVCGSTSHCTSGLLGGLEAVQPELPEKPVVVQMMNPASSWDIHIHLPSGSIPKDGPSAGITLACALISLLSGRCVRDDTAMTGELTLRGLVLPVGGIKEKLLAARHAGLSRVIIPARNMRDVHVDLPQSAREKLNIIPVETLMDVLLAAFDPPYLLIPRARL